MSKINLDFVPEPTKPGQWTKEDWRKKILLDRKLFVLDIREDQRILAQKGDIVAKMVETAMSYMDDTIEDLNYTIIEKNNALTEKDKVIAEKDFIIKQLTNELEILKSKTLQN